HLEVDRRKLELLGGIAGPFGETYFLFFLVDAEPVLQQNHAVLCDQALEHRTILQELFMFGWGAETHYWFDAGAVVPAAVEQDKFAATGQMAHVALEVPLAALAFSGFPERDR